jgi:hypothetical protein
MERDAADHFHSSIALDNMMDSTNAYLSLLHFKPALRTCDMRIVIAKYSGPDRFTSLPIEVLLLICDANIKGYISNVLRCVCRHLAVLQFKSWFVRDDRWASDRLALVNNRLNLGTFMTEDVNVEGLRTIDIFGKRFVGFVWRCPSSLDNKVTAAIRERCALLRIPVPEQFRRINTDALRSMHRGSRRLPFHYFASAGERQLLSLQELDKILKTQRKKTWKYESKSYGHK